MMKFLIIVIIGAGIYFIFPLVVRDLMRFGFRRTRRSGTGVAITFDDGPDPSATPEILNALSECGAKATFFLLAGNVEANPELAAKILSGGHEVGEHSYGHFNPLMAGPVSSLRDLNRCRRVMSGRMGLQGKVLFRPPFGKFNAGMLLYLLVNRRRVIFWDIDPRDYASGSPEQIAEYVSENIRAGQVVLLHDGRQTKGGPSNRTPEAVRMILGEIKRRNLSALTVSEILNHGTASRQLGHGGSR